MNVCCMYLPLEGPPGKEEWRVREDDENYDCIHFDYLNIY